MGTEHFIRLQLADASSAQLKKLGKQLDRWQDSAMDQENCECCVKEADIKRLLAGKFPYNEARAMVMDLLRQQRKFTRKAPQLAILLKPSPEHVEEQSEASLMDLPRSTRTIYITVRADEESDPEDCIERLRSMIAPEIIAGFDVKEAEEQGENSDECQE